MQSHKLRCFSKARVTFITDKLSDCYMRYLILILSLIQPMFALPLAINEGFKRYNSSIISFVIALAFASLSYALVPTQELDLYRHYERIDSLQGIPLGSVLDYSRTGYVLFDLLAWLINYIKLPHQAFTAIIVFISYYLLLTVFKYVKREYLLNTNKSVIALGLLTFILSVNFVSLASGLRNSLANIVVFYASYLLFKNNKLFIFIFLSILATYLHPASAIPALIVLIAYTFPWLSKYAKPMITLSIICMLGSKVITPVIEYLDSLASYLPFYSGNSVYTDLDNRAGGAFSDVASLRGWIAAFIIYRLPTYLSLIYLAKLKPPKDDRLYLALCLSVLYLGIFFSYLTLFLRYNNFYIYLFSLFLILEYAKKPNRFNFYFTIYYIISVFLINFTNFYSFRHFILSATEAFYTPLPMLLSNI